MVCNCGRGLHDIKYTKYWALPCEVHTTAKAARAAMDQQRFYYPKSIKKQRAIPLCRRAARGLISYDQCSLQELQDFAKGRGLGDAANLPTSKPDFIALLERADEELTFHGFMDLPPELRLRVYTSHFSSFDMVSFEPAPILAVSRLVRREARPLFYESSRFKIVLSNDWTTPTTDTRSRLILQPKKPAQRFFDKLDLDILSRINKLRIVYYGDTSSVWDMDIPGAAEGDIVRYTGHPPHRGWLHDLSEEDMQRVASELLVVAKDIAARPRRHKVERGDLQKLAGPTITALIVDDIFF